jgi:hypothetical protein
LQSKFSATVESREDLPEEHEVIMQSQLALREWCVDVPGRQRWVWAPGLYWCKSLFICQSDTLRGARLIPFVSLTTLCHIHSLIVGATDEKFKN